VDHTREWLDETIARARPLLDGGLGVMGWAKPRGRDATLVSGEPAHSVYTIASRCVMTAATRERLVAARPLASLRKLVRAPLGCTDVTCVVAASGGAFVIVAAARQAPLERQHKTMLRHLAARIEVELASKSSVRDLVLARHKASSIDAAGAWQDLLAGRLVPVDNFEHEGRRYLITRERTASHALIAKLSRRELDVVSRAARGHANKLIGHDLGLSEQTVATHLTRARAKLGVRSPRARTAR
jgi:DNA-binding CsgD family transcriptional regulator